MSDANEVTKVTKKRRARKAAPKRTRKVAAPVKVKRKYVRRAPVKAKRAYKKRAKAPVLGRSLVDLTKSVGTLEERVAELVVAVFGSKRGRT